MVEPKRIGILDLDSIIFSCFNPDKELDENEVPKKDENDNFIYKEIDESQIISNTDILMNSILSKTNCTHYIAYVKGKGNFRYNINPEYKANRVKKEVPKYWNFTKQYLIDTWGAVEANTGLTEGLSVETDDLCKLTYEVLQDSFIIAIDQDLLSLPGTHYNWKKDEYCTNTLDNYLYKFFGDMIAGQSSDNIKGLEGKGKKYVQKLFENYRSNELCNVVFDCYKAEYGEYKGINEFYKTYNSLLILGMREFQELFGISNPEVLIPEPIEYKPKEIKEIKV